MSSLIAGILFVAPLLGPVDISTTEWCSRAPEMPPCTAPAPFVHADSLGDTLIRRTDWGADGFLDEFVHVQPDLSGWRVGNWSPDDAFLNLYEGCFDPQGVFIRFDLLLSGWVNPPGPLAQEDADWVPFRHGPNPVFGFVEFDMDRNVDTGGDTQVPEVRYLGNVARFGGKPSTPRFADRVAMFGTDNDGNAGTPPYVERSGEEFHLFLLGDLIDEVFELEGDGDAMFAPGDVWITRGPQFHRAHGFDPFSSSGGDGRYEPIVDLRWEYLPAFDATIVSLVMPLTNEAAALAAGQAVEPMNDDESDQASILEAMTDLTESVAAIPLGSPIRSWPSFQLVAQWEGQSPEAVLDASTWDMNLLVGMAYVNEDVFGDLFAWTDVSDDPLLGDISGDGRIGPADAAAFNSFVAEFDGDPTVDLDAHANGEVILINFGQNFSMFDLNYDGLVNPDDKALILIRGDMNGDDLIDAADLLDFVETLIGERRPRILSATAVQSSLPAGDMNQDGLMDGRDIPGFLQTYLEFSGGDGS